MSAPNSTLSKSWSQGPPPPEPASLPEPVTVTRRLGALTGTFWMAPICETGGVGHTESSGPESWGEVSQRKSGVGTEAGWTDSSVPAGCLLLFPMTALGRELLCVSSLMTGFQTPHPVVPP